MFAIDGAATHTTLSWGHAYGPIVMLASYVQSDLLNEKRKPRGIRTQPSGPMALTPLKLGEKCGETWRRTLGKIECSSSSVSLDGWKLHAELVACCLAMFSLFGMMFQL